MYIYIYVQILTCKDCYSISEKLNNQLFKNVARNNGQSSRRYMYICIYVYIYIILIIFIYRHHSFMIYMYIYR